MHTKKLIAGVAVAALILPSLSFAQTLDLQIQVKSLMEQIQALQLQLKTLLSANSAEVKENIRDAVAPGQVKRAICVELKRDLRVGAQGEDVRKLQEMLAADPENGFRAQATGFFGPLTATAMAKYQERMGIASSTDGRVGPLTRGFFQRACGQGVGPKVDMMNEGGVVRGEITAVTASSITVQPVNDPPTIVNFTASTTIKVHITAGAMPTDGTTASLIVGTKVMAQGQKNADGSITARMITIGILPPEPPMKPILRGGQNQ